MFVKLKSHLKKIELIPGIIFVSVLSLLLSLGTWQLSRAEEKLTLMNDLESRMAMESLQLSDAAEEKKAELRYRKVTVAGHYDAQHSFLIDNQISDGKPGYLVMTPFILKGETKAVLINRGWLPLTSSRSVLPNVAVTDEETVINGRINDFPGVGIKLAGAEIPGDTWPSVVQLVNSEVLGKKLGMLLFSFQIELNKDLPHGFKRNWQTTLPMPPEKHRFYALQWFALALTFTVLFFFYTLKKTNDSPT